MRRVREYVRCDFRTPYAEQHFDTMLGSSITVDIPVDDNGVAPTHFYAQIVLDPPVGPNTITSHATQMATDWGNMWCVKPNGHNAPSYVSYPYGPYFGGEIWRIQPGTLGVSVTSGVTGDIPGRIRIWFWCEVEK